jgi:uroporphyrinogen decarboxylase
MFKKLLFPRYKKVVDFAGEYGCDISLYDSDGNINAFMELYFEAGINCFQPCEVAADMDPVDLRKRYGKKIRMIGGIDKRILSRSREEIREEVMKKVPIIEEGGYIPKIDHSTSADISWENFSYYINLLKDIYGE